MSFSWSIAGVFVLAALLAAAVLRWLLRRGALSDWHDLPNHRSLHTAPTPRVGGVGLMAGWLGAMGVAVASKAVSAGAVDSPVLPPAVLAGAALVFLVSLLDDRRSVGPLPRLLVQALAAVLLVAGLAFPALGEPLGAPAGLLGAAALALAALWMMNLYNFMDGADGLAGGMALFGFGAYAVVAWDSAPAVALVSAAVAGGALGFLVFNFPPARVFMGDAGSVPLGYLAAAIGMAGVAAGAWGWWLPPLVFLPFVADASLTLARRALRGERVWEAHREHGYQKLVLLGWSHRQVAAAWYLAMAACSAVAILAGRAGVEVQWASLAGMSLGALVLLGLVEAAWRRRALRASSRLL